mgnify:CR=1 FL=1
MRTFEISYLEKIFGNLDTVVQRVLESTIFCILLVNSTLTERFKEVGLSRAEAVTLTCTCTNQIKR